MKGMMNMNMQSLMAQARKLQGDIERITKEIENTTFKYENDYVWYSFQEKKHREFLSACWVVVLILITVSIISLY